MKSITSAEEFEKEVINSEIPVLVDFWATWCGPCKMLGTILEGMESKLGDKARIIKVDIEENEDLAVKYEVTSIPTVLIYRGGEVGDRFEGLKPEKTYLDALGQE